MELIQEQMVEKLIGMIARGPVSNAEGHSSSCASYAVFIYHQIFPRPAKKARRFVGRQKRVLAAIQLSR